MENLISMLLVFLLHVDAKALNSSFFGAGSGPIFMDDVTCSGYEVRLVDCSYNIHHNYFHTEDAACYMQPWYVQCVFTSNLWHYLSLVLLKQWLK